MIQMNIIHPCPGYMGHKCQGVITIGSGYCSNNCRGKAVKD